MRTVQEPKEDMLEMIMKRLGVQKSVMVTRDLVVSYIYSTTWAIILTLFVWGVFFSSEIGLEVLLLFALLNQT